MAAALAPRVRTLVVCEAVKPSRIEADVYNLKGVRYRMITRAFPCRPPRLWLYLLLSSPRAGRFPGAVRIEHGQTGRVALFAKITPDPEFQQDYGYLPVAMRLNCEFRDPGVYWIEVGFFQPNAGDVVKAQVPFFVEQEEI